MKPLIIVIHVLIDFEVYRGPGMGMTKYGDNFECLPPAISVCSLLLLLRVMTGGGRLRSFSRLSYQPFFY